MVFFLINLPVASSLMSKVALFISFIKIWKSFGLLGLVWFTKYNLSNLLVFVSSLTLCAYALSTSCKYFLPATDGSIISLLYASIAL